MVVTNTVSGRQDVVAPFYENKLGIDVDVCIHEILTISFVFLILVQDNYHIIIFDGSTLKDATSLKSHVTFVAGQDDRIARVIDISAYTSNGALQSAHVAGTPQKTTRIKR